MSYTKYKPYPTLEMPGRRWPDNRITSAPIWCSVDLRDGNQALPTPMNSEKKLRYFNLLKQMGFREIEVGFPSASQTDFDFMRALVDGGYITEGIVPQVLVQSREHLIRRTFESLEGCKTAILHYYLSTSAAQRRVVFQKSRQEIIDMAVSAGRLIESMKKDAGADIRLEFSPESFTGTEIDFALEICERVLDVHRPTPDNKMIINIPATVEMTTPNVFADQIEWFLSHVSCRDSIILSIHAHNDRGCGVAATELALLAGADRVEGTLFGNGERTGNADILTIAMNMYSRGVDPGLVIGSINEIRSIYEDCTGLAVHQRHPYAGELVYTAFSGSHQDAIRKGLIDYEQNHPEFWEVPYLPIDPGDIGRAYEPIIRINSQSGKGGVAFIMESEFGYRLPKPMHPEFAQVIQKKTDETGRELVPAEIMQTFTEAYFEATAPLALAGYMIKSSNGKTVVQADIEVNGKARTVENSGNGPISAFFNAIKELGCGNFKFRTYEEHALGSGENAEAVAYIELVAPDGRAAFGVGRHHNTTTASFKAVLCAINRMTHQ